jgi:hypothetical protein
MVRASRVAVKINGYTHENSMAEEVVAMNLAATIMAAA